LRGWGFSFNRKWSEGLDYHKVRVLNESLELEWKFSKDIKEGDYLVGKLGENKPLKRKSIFEGYTHHYDKNNSVLPIKFNQASLEEWYYFFGVLLGDGYNKNAMFKVCSMDQEILDFVMDFTTRIGLNPHIAKKSKGRAKDITFHSSDLACFFKFLGFELYNSPSEKRIPYKLLENGDTLLANLISGLFDTDGHCCVERNKAKRSVRGEVGFTSTSSELINQVQCLLLNMGVLCKKFVTFKGGESKFFGKTYQCKKAWSISIRDALFIKKWKDLIGFKIKRKSKRLDFLNEKKHPNGTFSNYIPYVGDYLKKETEKKGLYETTSKGEYRKSPFRKNTSRNRIKDFISYGQFSQEITDKLKGLLREDLFFSKVVKIEESEDITVDLQVKREHNYIANGLINHNSFGAGIFTGLYSLFRQGITIGIISSTFRQCLSSDSLIKTKRGILQLKDVKRGDLAFARKEYQKIANKWKNKPSSGIKLTTKKSYGIEGKIGHKVLTFNPTNLDFEYKNIEDIKIGDITPISTKQTDLGESVLREFKLKETSHDWVTKQFNQPKEDDLDFYYLLGAITGNGYFKQSKLNSNVSFISADHESLNYVQSIFQKILPDSIIKQSPKKGSKAINLRASSNALGQLFEYMGYKSDTTALDKRIPSRVLMSRRPCVASFLRGLMDADGGCFITKRNATEVTLPTSSRRLAKEVHVALLNFGIISKISEEPAKGKMQICGIDTFGNESYKVRITGYENIKKYNNHIGFNLSRKQEKLDFYLANCDRKTIEKETTIPQIGPILKEKYTGIPNTIGLGKHIVRKLIRNNKIKDPNDVRKLESLLEEEFYYDAVASLEPVEDLETYDIEVDNEHCYWGNGFINHNSKLIFQKLEDISKLPGAGLFAQCITSTSKQNDQWHMKIGDSNVYALPLGTSGDKLRGFRFQVILLDEALLIPEDIINNVLMPFLSVVPNPTERDELHEAETKLIEQGLMKESDRYVWPANKMIMLSSPSYKFEYLYQLYSKYERLITKEGMADEDIEEENSEEGSAHRSIIHLSYEALPDRLYDAKFIKHAKETFSQSQFDREIKAIFTDDSSGFFKMSSMAACTIPEGESPCVEIKGDPDEEYIVAFDPSWSETESSDDWALQVMKLDKSDPEKKRSILVHSYGVAGLKLIQHINYFHYILTHFNVIGIVGDYNGGVTFINACNSSELFKKSKIKINTIDVPFERLEERREDLIEAKNQYNRSDNRICILRKPTNNWIRYANERLQRAIDRKTIWFASKAFDEHLKQQRNQNIPINKLEFLSKGVEDIKQKVAGKLYDFIEHQYLMIQATKAQCALIVPCQTSNGNQTFNLPPEMRRQSGANKARKDSYSSLILGNWMAEILFEMEDVSYTPVQSTFTPQLI
jgi:intein/homing endonuclease